MARTRQKRKAKRREQQLKSTPRTAAARQQPTNPAEEAVIQAAESLEAADELEEIEMGVEPEEAQATATEDLDRVSTEAAEPETKPARKERRPAPRQRKPAPERQKEKEPRKRGRVVNFLVQVWAELRRVQWPDRNQVTQATGVVVVFCFIAGAYLAWWDWVFTKFVTWIL